MSGAMLRMPSLSAIGAELVDSQMLMLFPTPIFTGRLPDLSLCDRIEQYVRQVRKSGEGRSSPKGASPAYITPDNLHTRAEMAELAGVAMTESGKVLDAYAIKRDSHYITGMWANITHPNHRQNVHVHPNCLLSGLIYVKAPPRCGPTMFLSPRKLSKNFEPQYQAKNDLNSDFFVMPAEKGRMLIWPSHMPHVVDSGTSDESEERIVVAFNVMIHANIDLFTARLDLT
jgi:uncharacterized protein (TIGR02466 family)